MKERVQAVARKTGAFVGRHRVALTFVATATAVGYAYRKQIGQFNDYLEDRELGNDFELWFDTEA